MLLDSDYVLIGTGVAPLATAYFLLQQHKKVLLLNPDYDFFIEDSEFGFDFRPESNRMDTITSILRPGFPGAVETWPSPQKTDPLAPHIRQREWFEWSDKSGLIDPELAYLKHPGRNLKGNWKNRLTDYKVKSHGALGDVDVHRYRLGLLEFVTERLGHERIILGAGQPELFSGGVRFQSPTGTHQIKVGQSAVFFWTPRLTRIIKEVLGLSGTRKNQESPSTIQYWEKWSLTSKEKLDPSTLALWPGSFVYAEIDGAPEPQNENYRLSVLRHSEEVSFSWDKPMNWLLSETWDPKLGLEYLKKLTTQFLGWEKFSIHSMEPKKILTFSPHNQALIRLDPKKMGLHYDVSIKTQCQGSMTRVIQKASELTGYLTGDIT